MQLLLSTLPSRQFYQKRSLDSFTYTSPKKENNEGILKHLLFQTLFGPFFWGLGGWDGNPRSSPVKHSTMHATREDASQPVEMIGEVTGSFLHNKTIELTHILNRLESSWEWIYFWNHLMRYDFNSSNTVFGFDPSLSHWRCLLILIENDPCFPCFCKFVFDQWLLLLHDIWKSLSHNGWPEKVVDKKQQERNSASSNCCCVSSERMHFPSRKIWESGLPIPFQWLHVTSSKPNQNHRHLPLIQWQLDHLSKCLCKEC